MKKKSSNLTFKEKIGYALTAFGSDMTTQFAGSFLQLFYTSVIGINIGVAGLVISLSVIWDAINDPIIANWVDNHKFKNGERIRPVLLYSCVPFALFFVLIFTSLPSSVDLTLRTIYAFGMYFLYMIPRTFYYIPVFTMRQVASRNVDDRISLNTYVSFGQAFGSALPTLAIYPIVEAVAGKKPSGDLINPQLGYAIGAIIIAAIIVAVSLYNYFTTQERVKTENKKTNLFKAIAVCFKDKNFTLNLLLFFFYGLIVTLTTGYAAYYAHYVIGGDKASNIIIFISGCFIVGTLIATPLARPLYKKVGRKWSVIIGAGVLALGAVIFAIFGKTVPFTSYVFGACVGLGTAVCIIVIGLNRADVTDIIAEKEGKRMDGMVSNASSFANKLVKALVTFLITQILAGVGFIESTDPGTYPEQPESVKLAIVLVMGLGVLICAIAMVVSALPISIDKDLQKYNVVRENKSVKKIATKSSKKEK